MFNQRKNIIPFMVMGIMSLAIVLAIPGMKKNVYASTSQRSAAEIADDANSWRYEDGEEKQTQTQSNALWNFGRVGTKPWNATGVGIDVSYHNGVIDWAKVKNDGIDYAILRCGYGQDYTSQDDTQFEQNAAECERLGIPYGVYLYSYATDTTKAYNEAVHTIRLIQGKKLSYPLYYDMEDKTAAGLSATTLGNIATTYLDTLKASGYTNLGVYANKDWFTNRLTASVFSQYPKWLAQYNSTCTYDGVYHMWQYTSTGSVDGIKGNVDMNYKIGNWGTNNVGIDYAKVSLNAKTGTLTVGGSRTLKATSKLGTATVSRKVTWSSSSTSKATVSSSGKVLARRPGKVTITAKISNGSKATYTLTIKPKTNKIKSLKKSKTRSVKISFSKVSYVTKYQIYMSRKKSSGYKRIKSLTKSKSSYTKGKLTRKKTYYFKVRSYARVSGKVYYSSFSGVRKIKR